MNEAPTEVTAADVTSLFPQAKVVTYKEEDDDMHLSNPDRDKKG